MYLFVVNTKRPSYYTLRFGNIGLIKGCFLELAFTGCFKGDNASFLLNQKMEKTFLTTQDLAIHWFRTIIFYANILNSSFIFYYSFVAGEHKWGTQAFIQIKKIKDVAELVKDLTRRLRDHNIQVNRAVILQ